MQASWFKTSEVYVKAVDNRLEKSSWGESPSSSNEPLICVEGGWTMCSRAEEPSFSRGLNIRHVDMQSNPSEGQQPHLEDELQGGIAEIWWSWFCRSTTSAPTLLPRQPFLSLKCFDLKYMYPIMAYLAIIIRWGWWRGGGIRRRRMWSN